MRKFSRSVLFLTVAVWSAVIHAAAFNEATYQLRISQVTSPNGFLGIVKNVGDSQQFFETAVSPPSLAQISGNEQTPVATFGLGFAQGIAFASASAGILKAAVLAETQAVAQTTTNVGGAAFARAVATFRDSASITVPSLPVGSLIFVTGALLLDGNLSVAGAGGSGVGFAEVHVGGLGLGNNGVFGEWIGKSTGVQKSPRTGNEPWVPGTPVVIPFGFGTTNGSATEMEFFLSTNASVDVNFSSCVSFGGLCEVLLVGSRNASVDYRHTLKWGGLAVSNSLNGPALEFGVSSLSGFDYSRAFVEPVPLPPTILMMIPGLIGLFRFRTKGTRD